MHRVNNVVRRGGGGRREEKGPVGLDQHCYGYQGIPYMVRSWLGRYRL